MQLAVLKYSSHPDAPAGMPGEWPYLVMEIEDGAELPGPLWVRMTPAEYAAHRANHQAAYDAWWNDNKPTPTEEPFDVGG